MNTITLKISFLLPCNGVGGGVRAIVKFGNELIARGHGVRIFYRQSNARGLSRIRSLYNTFRYGPMFDWLSTFNGCSYGYDTLNPEAFSRDELVVSMCARTTLDAAVLPETTGIKVLFCHGTEIDNWDMMLESWRLAMPTIVVSPHLTEVLKREAGKSVLGVVPNGVESSEYFPCAESVRAGTGAILGTSYPKDPVGTMRVMRMLESRLPGTPRYLFSSARSHYPVGDIAFIRQPTPEQARRIYSSCKVWFLTSISEGFAMPVLEAMACGCVVVSTRCGGPESIIRDGVNGFLVDTGNTGAMVHKIVQIHKDEALRTHLSANAIATAKDFTWSKSAEKLEDFLTGIYKDKTGCEVGRLSHA